MAIDTGPELPVDVAPTVLQEPTSRLGAACPTA